MDFDAMAQNAANVLVGSMVTDGWGVLKAGVVKLFKKGEECDEQELSSDLEASRIAVLNAGVDEADGIKASAVRQWRACIRRQLEDDLEFATQWAALVAEVKADVESGATTPQVRQIATGDRGARIVQIGRDSHGRQL